MSEADETLVEMRVFISWSGPQSQVVAMALAEWLPDLLPEIEPFQSEQMQAGSRALETITSALDDCVAGIVCVTQANRERPWLNFEAGALAKRVGEGGFAMPLAIDLKPTDIGLPMSLLQIKSADRDGMRDIVAALNEQSARPRPQASVDRLFDKLWPDLRKAIEQANANPDPLGSVAPERDHGELLQEILETVRGLRPDVQTAESSVRERIKQRGSLRSKGPVPEIGERVTHGQFGDGVVVGAESEGIVTVEFDHDEEKELRKLFWRHAPMARIEMVGDE